MRAALTLRPPNGVGTLGTTGHPTARPTLFGPDPIRLPALRMRQSRDRLLYALAVDGKRVEEFAAASRVGWDDRRRIVGYQRPEVLSHVAEIRADLESDNPMLPNAVVVAFDPAVRFEPLATPDARADAPAVPGELVIPLPAGPDARKPGWVMGG